MDHRRIAAGVLAMVITAACAPFLGSPSTPIPTVAVSPTAAPATSPGASRIPTVVASGDLVSSNAVRVAADATVAKRAAAGVQMLGADVYRDLANKQTNLVFSPYSIAIALAMTRIGAQGTTAQQMDAVLHAREVGDLDQAFNALDQELAKRPGSYPYGFGPGGQRQTVPLELATANRLWGQRGFAFATPFLDRLSAHYGAGVGIVDYVRAREIARKTINDWVSERTKTRIPELITEGVLNELTRFVLTNAIYMKAKWERPFQKTATAAGDFHRLDGSVVRAQMMGSFGSLPYAKGSGYQTVSLPYVGGLSMIVIVPDRGSLRTFEGGLDGSRLDAIASGLKPQYVALKIPRFSFRTASPLTETLKRLGMPIAFTDRADFSGISPQEPLAIQAVVHEAFIAVDEEGTEAAAATAVIGGATGGPSESVELTIDRPFVFLVRDDATGAILFMGRVLDPS